MKLLRWLRSRPLARVRRTLVIRKRAAKLPACALAPEVRAFYDREFRRLAGLDKVER